MNISFLAFKFNSNYNLLFKERSFLSQITFFLVLILVLEIFRLFMDKILKSASSKTRLIKDYHLVSGNIKRASGLFLFPLLLLLGFSELDSKFLIIISISMLGLTLMIKWFKGFLLGFGEEGIGILQILTYFCALEILPQLVLVKYTIETFKSG